MTTMPTANADLARILVVAGSDSGGGAGIQADIKTITALGGYGMTAVTAITVQNTLGVSGIHSIPVDIIVRQMEAVLTDIGADAVKTGMLHSTEIIEAVSAARQRLCPDVPIIVDPVMVATSGDRLLEDKAVDALKRDLLVQATILTPNIPEAEVLTGMTIRDEDDMVHAAHMLLTLGPQVVVMKGAHLPTETIKDLVISEAGQVTFEHPRVKTTNTHGTGCTLASAIATGIGQGMEPNAAIDRARNYVLEGLRTAPSLGGGNGPINHLHPIQAAQAG